LSFFSVCLRLVHDVRVVGHQVGDLDHASGLAVSTAAVAARLDPRHEHGEKEEAPGEEKQPKRGTQKEKHFLLVT
jgi:hypothetical protein